MKAFARLLERLAFTASRNAKLALTRHYLEQTPDPDRGWALAALTGTLELRNVPPTMLRKLISERVDAQLFALSYDFVGDLAETIALLWPEGDGVEDGGDVSLSEAVDLLANSSKAALPAAITDMLNRLSTPERLAFLKLATGNMRVGLSGRLARVALAQTSDKSVEEIEEIWHSIAPPYEPIFNWLNGEERPDVSGSARFRPVMLSTPVTLEELGAFNPADYVAEWKWDGIRVQAVAQPGGERRLYSRTGEDISGSFPDLVDALNFDGVLDGELLIRRGADVAPFADLQKRLGRKAVSKAIQESHPAALRVYDMLLWQGDDMRGLPLDTRRMRLEQADFGSDRIDLSPLLPFDSWDDLAALRLSPPEAVIEGVMIKRRDSFYVAGRPRGPWFKWKRDPMRIDAVLLYAQSGHGKRSGFYSDFTFGVWQGEELVPVGKAYFGFTDEELRKLDRFVRKNTVQRFGPVRQVAPLLVLEIAFEGLNLSSRHKSGLAMRFPRIAHIRWDKPAQEADTLENLQALL